MHHAASHGTDHGTPHRAPVPPTWQREHGRFGRVRLPLDVRLESAA